MADDQQNLQVTITATDAGATAVLADVQAKIEAIEAELKAVGASGASAGSSIASGMSQVADKAGAASGAAAVLGGSAKAAKNELSDLNEVGGNAARMFSALGVEGGEAAGRVGALVGALGSMTAVAPELVAFFAVLAAGMAVFDFFKQGVKDAEDLQSEMSSMGASIRAQGGDWSALSGQIKEFIDSESMASGFTENEMASALNSLVTSLAGVESGTKAVSDSEKILAVAEEVAIAKHISLAEATHDITEAEAGRGMALAQLDPRIKTMIQDHDTLDQVLKVLHDDYQDQLKDTDSAQMAQARLHAALAATGEELGSRLLPYIVQLSTELIGIIPAAEDMGSAVVDVFQTISHTVGIAIHDITAFHDAVDLVDIGHVNEELNKSLADQNWLSKNDPASALKKFQQAATDYGKAYKTAENEITAAIKQHIAAVDNLNTSFNPTLGTKAPSSGSGYTPPVLTDEIDQDKLETQAQEENMRVSDALADAKDRATVAEASLSAAMKDATTVAGEQSAQAALDAKTIEDLSAQHKILNNAIYDETRMLGVDSAAHQAATAKYEAAKAALTSFTQAHAGEKEVAEADKETIEKLRAAYQGAEQEWEKTGSVVHTLTGEIRAHREEAARDAAQQLTLASSARDAAASAERDWDKYYQDQQQKAADDLATFRLSNAQKVVYFAQQLSSVQSLISQNQAALDALYQEDVAAFKAGDFAKVRDVEQTMAQISALILHEVDQAKQYDEDELNAKKEILQQEADAYKAMIDKEEQITQTFLDDILTEHKTFAQEIKSVMDSMLKDYIAGMSKAMFPQNAGQTGSTNGFAQFFQGFFGGVSGSSAQTQNADTQLQNAGMKLESVATGPQTQAAQALSGSAQQLDQAALALQRSSSSNGGTSGLATYPTPSGNALVTYTGGVDADEITTDFNTASTAGDNTTYPLSGGQSIMLGWNGASTASLGGDEGDQALSEIPGVGVPLSMTNVSSVAPAGASSAFSKIGSYVSEALMGYMMGQSINSLENPNEAPGDSSATFAGIGGALGDIGGTIVGGPVGGFIGSILGSLVGGLFGNHETEAQEPDIYTPGYGQFVSNMIGTYGTYNGQTIQAQQAYNQYEGGTPEGQQVYQELADLPKNLSPVVEGLASQLRALEDGDTNSNALEIKSESQGMFTLESGATVSVQQYMQMIGEFMSETAGMIPTFQLTRAYPNLNKSTLKQTGEYDPTVSYGPLPPQGTPPPYSNQPGYPNGPSGPNGQRQINLTVNVNGTVIGGGQIPDQVAQEIAQALQRLDIGTAAGGISTRLGSSRGGGGDW
jgi:hypothetical protein